MVTISERAMTTTVATLAPWLLARIIISRLEGLMRNDWIIGSMTAGMVLGGLLAAAPLRAESKKKPVDQITCEEFLALDPDSQQRIAYWVDGYQVAKGDAVVGTVAFDKFGQPVAALVDDCKATPKETLWQKLKKHL